MRNTVKMKTDIPAVTRFVRQVLGCSCPDEVFRQVEITRGSTAVTSCVADFQVRIGNRLLIFISSAPDQLMTPSRLEAVITEGKRARDAAGLNRFRLVVAAPDPAPWREQLLRLFDSASSRDAKTHLHVVDAAALPGFLAPPKAKR